jgi:HSP20 family protein
MAESKREIARWNPFAELDMHQDFGPAASFLLGPRFSRWMEDAFRGTERGAMPAFALDVTESDKAYAISAELAGVKKDDLTVECKDGVLTIRGEKKSEREEKKDHGRILERTYGSFSRSLRLPPDANADRIDASFKDGVLKLQIEKRPEAKATTVAVKG